MMVEKRTQPHENVKIATPDKSSLFESHDLSIESKQSLQNKLNVSVSSA